MSYGGTNLTEEECEEVIIIFNNEGIISPFKCNLRKGHKGEHINSGTGVYEEYGYKLTWESKR